MVADRSPEAAAALEGPGCPFGLEYLWEWYIEVSAVRTGNGFDANPITWTELDAWCRMTRRQLLPFERHAFGALDRKFLETMASKK